MKVSLFILGFFIVGLGAYYLKYRNESVELRGFDYSKSDSSFYSVNFENKPDSIVTKSETVYKAKELPKGKININKAGAEELAKLPGIGIKTAGKILEYRKKIKSFKNTGQLMDIKGISTGKFNKLKDYVDVK